MANQLHNRRMRRGALAICTLLALWLAPESGAVMLNYKDDFEFETTQNWANGVSGGEPTVVTSGGPAGTADAYLLIRSGGSHPAPRMQAYNRSQWTGNYISAGVGRIEMHLKNSGPNWLNMRIALKDGTLSTSNGWVSTNAYALPNDGVWHQVVFHISESSMTQIGTASLVSVLTLVRELRLLHSSSPSLEGDALEAQVGVDNITALAPVDVTPPSVTIDQDTSQPDPGHVSPVLFRAVFSETVSGFTKNDVSFSGAGATTATVTEIAPSNGTTYRVAISGMTSNGTVTASIVSGAASDAVGNPSLASTSTDNRVTFIAKADSIAQAKMKADGVKVNLAGQNVTLVLSDRFFIEAPDRSNAVAVIPASMPSGLQAGTSVDVVGSVRTDAGGARYVDGAAGVQGSASPVPPVGMACATLGGEDWLSDPITGAGQLGVSGGRGLNNVGRLVRVWGTVSWSGQNHSGHTFYLDDGSGLSDGSGHPGVKVLSQEQPAAVGEFSSVQGAVWLENAGDRIVPVILK